MVDAVYGIPTSLLLITAGLISCFAGYRLFRFVLALGGFVGGAIVASSLFTGDSVVMGALVMLAGGLAGAALMTTAYFFGVALVGAVLGTVVAHLWVAGGDREPTVLVIVLFSVGGALLTMVLQRYVLIGGTAFAGAWAAVAGALLALGYPEGAGATGRRIWMPGPFGAAADEPWISVSWLVLAAVGLVVQLGWTAGEKRRLTRRRGSRRNE